MGIEIAEETKETIVKQTNILCRSLFGLNGYGRDQRKHGLGAGKYQQ